MIYDENNKVDIDTVYVGSVEIPNLPPVEYTAKIYREIQNESGWNPGTINPFQAPEPYFLRRGIPVREGFTSEVSVEFSGEPSGSPQSVSPDSVTTEQ